MPIYSIGNFTEAGLNTDYNPAELSKDAQTRMVNTRMANGGISPCGGHDDIGAFPIAGVVPQYMKFVRSAAGDSWIIACDKKVFAYIASATDVTPVSMPEVSDRTKWSIESISGIPVINHPLIYPQFMDAASSKFIPLPWKANTDWKTAKKGCNLIRTHKQFLIALGIIEDGKEIKDGVRWSAPADIGAVPTTWDELDTTNVAGKTNLGGEGGAIIGGAPMGDVFVIYRENGINLMHLVGGKYIWKFQQMQTLAGLISKDAVVDVNGIHYFMSINDIYVNDGNQIRSIATNRVKSKVKEIDKDHYKNVFAIHNDIQKEVWFCYPALGSVYSTRCMIYNYDSNCWTVRDLPTVVYAANGLQMDVSNTWDNLNTSWDSLNKSWDSLSSTPYDSVMMCINMVGSTQVPHLSLLNQTISSKTEPFTSIIERTDLVIGGVNSAKMIRRVYPHIIGAVNVQFQLGSQPYPGGPVSWKDPIPFTSGVDRKIDVRSSGTLHAYRITATNVSSTFVLTGMDFDFDVAGAR